MLKRAKMWLVALLGHRATEHDLDEEIRSDVRRMVLLNGVRLMSIGIAAGLLVALGATQMLTSLLYEVSTTDAVTYIGVAALVIAVGLVAAWIPAWRASSANPAVTLRAE